MRRRLTPSVGSLEVNLHASCAYELSGNVGTNQVNSSLLSFFLARRRSGCRFGAKTKNVSGNNLELDKKNEQGEEEEAFAFQFSR